MFGIEAGDWPGWIGAATGCIALIWNIGRALWSLHLQNESKITARLDTWDGRAILVVDYFGAQSHANYAVRICTWSPRALQGRVVRTGRGAPELLPPVTQPFQIPMQRDREDPTAVRAQIALSGYPSSRPLRLRIVVLEGLGRKVVAWRHLPMDPI